MFKGDIVDGQPTLKLQYIIFVRQFRLCGVERIQPLSDYGIHCPVVDKRWLGGLHLSGYPGMEISLDARRRKTVSLLFFAT